ncbi:hypothetical protein B0H16DRAFT_1721560 [Mycena metata]|uniref:Malate dehydrogenase n=1 Tax=Mycena metata TaxID=1033252 RepID=A0AAD7J8Y5_9AGAR|nr:hypothetical protein B0H16DRAFT_1721560 [Mycena metata]
MAPLILSAPINPGSCDTSKAVMDLPAGQTQLVNPSTPPAYVLLGVGVQNYTCSASGTYTTAGAVASLFDVSCLQNNANYGTLQDRAFAFWNNSTSPPEVTPLNVANDVGAPLMLGQHYFIANPNGSLSPKWDFTAGPSKDPNAFVVGAKVGDILAPTNSGTNVDWLSLNAASGTLANHIFRVDTVGGQPPSSCVVGSELLSVKYVARYYLY